MEDYDERAYICSYSQDAIRPLWPPTRLTQNRDFRVAKLLAQTHNLDPGAIHEKRTSHDATVWHPCYNGCVAAAGGTGGVDEPAALQRLSRKVRAAQAAQ